MHKSSVLITGASSGIGAVYAERFARRGHNLLLVARDKNRLETLARRLQQEFGVAVEVLVADLTIPADLHQVAARLRDDPSIGILINNAGIAQTGGFVQQTATTIEQLLALNITALTHLAHAAATKFVAAGTGSIINISSVLGLAPEFGAAIYSASKSYVLLLSQSLQQELSARGVYVQAVVPAGTYTEIWQRAGIDISAFPEMMQASALVDAALVGFDRRELVTIPPLQQAQRWDELDQARQRLLADLNQAQVAKRYQAPPLTSNKKDL